MFIIEHLLALLPLKQYMKSLSILVCALLSFSGAMANSVANVNETDSVSTKESGAVLRWSLQKCIEYALSHNLSIDDQQIGVDRAENAYSQDKWDRYPTLNASASHNYNFGRNIDPFTNQYINQSIQSNNFSLSAGVTVFNGQRITNTIRRSENEVMRSKLQAETTQNQIALSVANAFLQIIVAENQLRNFKEINKSTLTQLERAKTLYEGGATNQSQYLSFKAQDARDKMNIKIAEGSIRTAYVQLRQIMQAEEEFVIDVPELDQVPLTNAWVLEGVINNATSMVPDVKLAESQLKSAELSVKIAQSNLYPRIGAFANVNTLYSESRLERFNAQPATAEIGFVEGSGDKVLTQYSTYETRVTSFGQQLNDNFGQAAGLSVTIPIFNNNQVRANISDAKLNSKLQENNLARTETNIRANIIQAFTDYENALASYVSALENENAQKENYEFAKKSADAGVSTTADMLLALNDWSRAKNDVLGAKYQLIFSNTILNYYNTGEITITNP